MASKVETIISWFDEIKIMTKPNFYVLVQSFGVPKQQTKFYADLFRYFDLNCDGVMNKFEFCERLNKLRSFNDFDVVLDRFFELADPQKSCLLYTSPSPRDKRQSRMPSSA